jgi:hypothetical protein
MQLTLILSEVETSSQNLRNRDLSALSCGRFRVGTHTFPQSAMPSTGEVLPDS